MIFSMFQSNRNEDGAAFVMRWVIRILMNYTIGTCFKIFEKNMKNVV